MILQKNNIEVPEHLNKDFFQIVMQKILNTHDVHVKAISFKMASSPGDNYTSQMYQVEIVYDTCDGSGRTTSVVIKSIPINEHNKPIETGGVYEKEKFAYFEVHPRINALLPEIKFAPKCYYAIKEPIRTFVFEDLKALGHRNADREKGLDEFHAKMLLEKLGQYHAASILIIEKYPEVREECKSSIYNEEIMSTELFKNFFDGNFAQIITLAGKWPGYEKIVEKLKKMQPHISKLMLDSVDTSNDGIRVLNHGDVWVNNFMFKYDQRSPTPQDIVFVDFQIGFIGSPGIDINYFFNTSLQLDVLKKRDEFVSHYYNSFSKTLSKLGYKDIPSESALRHEVFRKEIFGLLSGCSVLPLVSLDRNESHDSTMETLADPSKMKEKQEVMFRSKRLSETYQYVLKRFDALKVLDCEL